MFPISVSRTDVNLDDLGLAFQDIGVQVEELVDYVRHVEPVPFPQEVPAYPLPKPNHYHFPRPGGRELRLRDEHIPDHLPSMHNDWSGKATWLLLLGNFPIVLTAHHYLGI